MMTQAECWGAYKALQANYVRDAGLLHANACADAGVGVDWPRAFDDWFIEVNRGNDSICPPERRAELYEAFCYVKDLR